MTYDTINAAPTVALNAEGTLLAGRYRIVRQLGRGGMGSVWLAEDTQLDDKPFAIKMLPSILVSNKRAFRQLKDEALVAMRLVHPNIVQIRAFEENNGNPFLVMDYIDGQTLDDYLAEHFPDDATPADVARPPRPCCKGEGALATSPGTTGVSPVAHGLPEADVLRVLKPIAAALDYAHKKGVVHRDVKPGNVMIAKDGTPYILDFGIAREIQETLTRVTGKLSSGTLLYMSPEQLMGEPSKPAQDVYSFAAMVYECLKGEPPFSHGQIEFQIMNKQPDPPPGGTQLVASVMAGLAKKPEDRPATCAAVLEGNNLTQRRREAESQGGRARSPSGPHGDGFSRVEHVERVDGVGGARRPAEPVGRHVPTPPQSGGPRPVAALKGIFVVALIAALAGGGWWLASGRNGTSKTYGTDATNVTKTPQVPEVSPGPAVSLGNPPKSAVPVTTNEPDAVTSPYPETHEEKARRAHELYTRREGRKILETFSDYDAEMVPEIAYLKGVVYRDGFSGVKKDLHKTAQYFTIAANRGHVQAQMDLATMYAEGLGVSRDLDKFLYWSEKVADQGVADAAFNMGYLYFSGGAGGRIKVDYTKALKYLKLAADAGRFSACPYLGTMYQKGWGVRADNMEALKWFKLGAENGDALSENNLGFMYLKGAGTPKDPAKALEYLQKADAHGNHGAAMSLGLMYENGDGVPQDLQEARRLYVRAKEHKVDGAEKALQRVDNKLNKGSSQALRPNAVPTAKPRAVGILTRPGDHSRSSDRAVDEVGKLFYERSYELTHNLPIIRNRHADKSGCLVAAGQLLALCREDEFSDLKVEEVEFYPTGEYLVVTMKNMQLVKIAWEGMYRTPTEESKKNLRVQLRLVWEALRAYPKSTDIFVAVQPGVVDMVPRWGRRFKASRPLKPQTITVRPAK